MVLQVDHSEDLPVGTQLNEEYCPPNQPPTKSQILEELGLPLTSAILTEANINIPQKVMTGVRYAPKKSEVLVYEETDRTGRQFTYFIFISPNTERYVFYHTIAGELRDDQWPRQPLR